MRKSLLVAVGLNLLLVGMAVAGPPEPGTTPVAPQPTLLARTIPGKCPLGWRLVPGSETQGGGYLCEVNVPQPGNCPPKHQWVSKCQGGKSVAGCKPVHN